MEDCLSSRYHSGRVSINTLTLPPSFKKKIIDTFGDAGETWLENLPTLIAESEKRLENHMVEHIKKVIMMFGKGFAFIGNQYRIEAKGNEYFIDMLFFNRILHSKRT